MMLAKKSPSQLRLVFLRAASQTTMAFSHCYTSLESFLKAKWQMMRPPMTSMTSTHVYEVRPRADHHGVDLISDVLAFSPLWYAGPNAISNAIKYAKFSSRSHDAVIRVYDEAGNVIETYGQAGYLFKPPTSASASPAAPSSVPAKSASAEAASIASALGGGRELVWVNTEKHVYHREGSRFYGTTKKGKYMTEREAIQTGNKAARLGSATAQRQARGRLPNAITNAIGYAKFRSRSHDAVIRVCDEAGNVIETHEHAGEFKEP
jgi:hypothetical protein